MLENKSDMIEPRVDSQLTPVRPSDVDTVKFSDARTPLSVLSFGVTDQGRVRASNQDQFLIATTVKALKVQSTSLPQPEVRHSSDRSWLFIVADGIGGGPGGEEASALAIDSVETFVLETFKWFAQVQGREEDKVLTDFRSAIGQANARIRSEAAEHPELRGMGTTLTLAYSLNDELFVAHVGDSRCYLFRHGTLHRLTRDHTIVEEMVGQGVLSAEEAEKHHWRHMITNAVGGHSAAIKVEVHKLQLEAGDAVLLATDGLTGMVPDAAIARILQSEANPESACQLLVASANEAGGKDNITVVVARFESAA